MLSVNAPLRRERRGGGCYHRAARLFLCPSERPGVKSQLMFIYSADVNTLHSHSGRNTQAHAWQRRAERKSACHCCRFTSLTNASPHKSTTGEDTRYSLRHTLEKTERVREMCESLARFYRFAHDRSIIVFSNLFCHMCPCSPIRKALESLHPNLKFASHIILDFL